MTHDNIATVQHRLKQLESENATLKARCTELEKSKGAASDDSMQIPISEFEETLRRLVQRTAMIVQAEKCLIMVHNRNTHELTARAPAFGYLAEDLTDVRVAVDTGVSGEVFRTGRAAMYLNAAGDERTNKEIVARLKVANGIAVPLIVEKRDDENHVTDRLTVGVLHCINKRYGAEFNDEDVRLLERLARNAAAVIANAQMFQEVVEEKQKLVHTLESMTAGLLLVTHQNRVGQINAQARTMFAVPDSMDPIGQPLASVVRHPECLAIIERQMALLAASPVAEEEDEENDRGKHDEITVVDEEAEEEYIYRIHSASVNDDANHPVGIVFIFNDITDIRNVERMKTEFVSIVSHELRTPLTPMKGFVRTLLDDEKEEWYTLEDRREFHQIIETNVDRLSRLINDLLNVSRIEKQGAAGIDMNFEDVDIRKAAEAVIETQKGMSTTHELSIDFEPETIVAETDPDKIQNIMQNLVSNAIKYSPDGKAVRVIGRVEPETKTIIIGIQDFGTGIPEAALKKLFTKFYRVDNKSTRKVGGTGIGLFLVKNLVQAHKGTIWVESEVGKGSTFWFRIPIKQPAEGEEFEPIKSGR